MKYGKIRHIGIVVKDINEAKAHYSSLLGIKKWYELVYDTALDMSYHGEKKNCNVKLYFGGKGATNIELIETSGDENIYTNFLKNHGEGLHHIQYNVKCLDCAIADAENNGLQVIQKAEFKSAGMTIKYAYVGKSEDGVILELIESTLPIGIKKGDIPFETTIATITGNYKLVK